MNASLTSHADLVDRYFDAWNETDPARRRALIETTWAPDASYVDPLLSGDGHDGIDAMIRAVHERFPGHTFERTTAVDGYANRVRFSWTLTTPTGAPFVKGSDFATVDAHGRLQTVVGFLDEGPAPA